MKKPEARVLPEGATVCGWCEEERTRADIAIRALNQIAARACWKPEHRCHEHDPCSPCVARATLERLTTAPTETTAAQEALL